LTAQAGFMNADVFEGYTGVRIEDGYLVQDILFTLVFLSLSAFALVFYRHYPLFIKIITESISTKERKNLFDSPVRKNLFFRMFLTFQMLFLSTIFLYASFSRYFGGQYLKVHAAPVIAVLFFCTTGGFYLFKQGLYLSFQLFNESGKYKLWKINYQFLSYLWGILLYPFTVWMLCDGKHFMIVLGTFAFVYILFRIILTYITWRIFHNRNADLLYLSSYLCAQEIVPLLFLYEGLDYLHNIIETGTLWH
jgi:hypothetical protein